MKLFYTSKKLKKWKSYEEQNGEERERERMMIRLKITTRFLFRTELFSLEQNLFLVLIQLY